MLPSELKAEQFNAYSPDAKAIATQNLLLLRNLPLSLVPGLLREIIEYDYKFPAERVALKNELSTLASLSAEQRSQWLDGFSSIAVSPALQKIDWVNSPAQFVEQLSADLWTTHQLDAFRLAATSYSERLHAAVPAKAPDVPRLGIAVIGRGVDSYSGRLFRKLRPHGAHFTHVRPENGLEVLLGAVADRATAHPSPYAHWYIDGGDAVQHDSKITCVSYEGLTPVRTALLRKMHSEIAKPGMGPENLRSIMAQLRSADLGFPTESDAVLDRFQVRLFTEGSGTQIFSTSFTQWAAREALRRAEPATLLIRFAPRQRQKPMNELISPSGQAPELDPLGSLVDADMGAYYTWLNQQRLPGAEKGSFLAWFEGHGSAVVIGPTVPRGTESNDPIDMKQLLSWVV